MNDDKQIQNAQPIAELMNALHRAEAATEAIIERDIKAGLYQLKAGPRKEQVKLLADQGLSTRAIAEMVGSSQTTVVRDLAEPSGSETITNGSLELDSMKENHKKEINKLNDKLKKANDKHKKEVENLQERILNLQEGPPPSDFEKQVDRVTSPLVSFIQHDDLVKMLSDLEIVKEDIVDELGMYHLERVIGALSSLSYRAETWSKRITPTNGNWNHRVRRLHKEEDVI